MFWGADETKIEKTKNNTMTINSMSLLALVQVCGGRCPRPDTCALLCSAFLDLPASHTYTPRHATPRHATPCHATSTPAHGRFCPCSSSLVPYCCFPSCFSFHQTRGMTDRRRKEIERKRNYLFLTDHPKQTPFHRQVLPDERGWRGEARVGWHQNHSEKYKCESSQA